MPIQNLLIDTRFFDQDFKDALLESIEDLDAKTNGLLINADNAQALRFLHNRYRGRVKCIYIDPPYNTGPSEIIYKNNYKHSSWLSMMSDRLMQVGDLKALDGSLIVAIDENEQERLGLLLEGIFPSYAKTCVTVVHNPRGQQGKQFSYTHEFAYFITPKGVALPKRKLAEEKANSLMKTGTVSRRREGRRMFYPIYVKNGVVIGCGDVPDDGFHPVEQTQAGQDGILMVWPLDAAGIERKWRYKAESLEPLFGQLSVSQGRGGRTNIYLHKSEEAFRSVWADARYNAGEYGSNLLKDMSGEGFRFSFPKSLNTVLDCVQIGLGDDRDGLVLDFFAGSGTTGHATITLNRRDDGKRKYVLVEMGDYFESVLKQRILKAAYSSQWKGGIPVTRDGVSHCFKYIVLESYDDSLNNLQISERLAPQGTHAKGVEAYSDYLFHYVLDFENRGSASLLNVQALRNPFDYKLAIERNGELQDTAIDLPETFNFLLGLSVHRVRNAEGIRAFEATDRYGEKVLVLWRTLNDDFSDNERLAQFVRNRGYVGLPLAERFARIYVNGDSGIGSLFPLSARPEVLLTDQVFRSLMFTES